MVQATVALGDMVTVVNRHTVGKNSQCKCLGRLGRVVQVSNTFIVVRFLHGGRAGFSMSMVQVSKDKDYSERVANV